MKQSPNTHSKTATVDGDLIEQANPGHGVPSQDPESAAQVLLEPKDAEREAKSVLTGGGMIAGAATGAIIGVVTAGPAGVLVGGGVGAVVGLLGAEAAGAVSNTEKKTKP